MANYQDPLQPILDLIGDLNSLQQGMQAVAPLTQDLNTDLQDLETALGVPVKAKTDPTKSSASTPAWPPTYRKWSRR